ncbi:hypothetical protein CN689_01000 [Peribacillus butanolivorans]|uniref:DUF4145 domain-containing protein n=1 Tax=Peribacillus butanolivorans TaxID=421767 RepID=A0AAX0S980_9BACI|nr:hypothetical protein [Peribacillus butanolivorans]PEJ37509.1 hypothetical protein CN689_01000 [Peribacillus butanolivorans]
MSKYDPYYDKINNKYSYYLFSSIKQYDTHVYFDLYEYIVQKDILDDYNARFIDKRIVKENIVLDKEFFLYLVLVKMFLRDKTIVKDKNLRWFQGDIKKVQFPSKYYIDGVTKKNILKFRDCYTLVFFVRAIDEEFVLFDFSIPEKGKVITGIKLCKPLFEKLANKAQVVVNYGTDFSELYYKIQGLVYMIQKPLFKRHYDDITNCFDIINTSPTMLTYSNIFKILSPTVEGLLRDFFNLNNIALNKQRDLGQIISEINQNQYFEKDIIELINLVHAPIRNFSLHGNVPSEKLSKLSVIVILEIYEILYKKLYKY